MMTFASYPALSRPAARQKKLMLAALIALVLPGCSFRAIGPDYKKPETPLLHQAGAVSLTEKSGQAKVVSGEPLPPDWWRLYQSPELDALIQQAFQHNQDLRVAMYTLTQARAALREAEGMQQPSIDINAQPSYGHPSGLSELQPGYVPRNAWQYSAGMQLSYQVDLFGQLKRAVETSRAESEAAQAAYDLVRVNVAAETSRALADICSTGLQLQTVKSSLSLQQESATLTARLVDEGRAGELDSIRARAQVASLEAAIPPLVAQQKNAFYRLATLTGTLPEKLPQRIERCHTFPVLQQPLPVGDVQALLRRRPDIRQRERLLAASTAQIGLEMADMYPKITLGLSGTSAGFMKGIGERDTRAWSIGPLISWTIPNTGVVQARIESARAGAGADLARFEKTVLMALQEVRTALNNYVQELQRYQALQQEIAARQKAAEKTRLLYSSGKVGYLDVLDAERTLADSQLALAQSEGQLSVDQVTLFLALGGGWQSEKQK
ncbi:TolC family protein [Serratia bockelmannii]|uniref:TolC family protein n=1 Tax=Serratia bockelmannii TaxID=2703793 RepID=UPI00313ECD98